MTDQLTRFNWQIAESGYSLKENPKGTWFLTCPIETGYKHYDPFREHTGLYRRFVELPEKPRAIREFANEFGPLGVGHADTFTAEPTQYQEPLYMWAREIRNIAFAERVRDMLNRRDQRGLSRLISWRGSEMVSYKSPETNRPQVIASKRTNPDLLEIFHPQDVIAPARVMLQILINQHLEGRVSGRMLFDKTFSRSNLYMVPDILLTALWLQLAKAVDGNKVYSQCAECRDWFEILSKDGGRSDKRFCNDACRARAWRKHKKQRT